MVRLFARAGKQGGQQCLFANSHHRPEIIRRANDVEQALGEERIRWLMAQTGMTREELIEGLRRFH